jgi:hypothetical protein
VPTNRARTAFARLHPRGEAGGDVGRRVPGADAERAWERLAPRCGGLRFGRCRLAMLSPRVGARAGIQARSDFRSRCAIGGKTAPGTGRHDRSDAVDLRFRRSGRGSRGDFEPPPGGRQRVVGDLTPLRLDHDSEVELHSNQRERVVTFLKRKVDSGRQWAHAFRDEDRHARSEPRRRRGTESGRRALRAGRHNTGVCYADHGSA